MIRIYEDAMRKPLREASPTLMGLHDILKDNQAFREVAASIIEVLQANENACGHQLYAAADLPIPNDPTPRD